MTPCPSPEQLALLLDERLDGPQMDRVTEHVQTCATCQQTLDSLAAAGSPEFGHAIVRAEPTDAYSPDPKYVPRPNDPGPTLDQTVEVDGSASIPAEAWERWPQVPGYEILAELGRGGMGVVYKARHLALNRLVALKMIRGGDLAGPEELARFHQEAEAVARFQHPHIVQIHEIGDYNGLPFFSLEYIEGGSLDRMLKTMHFLPRQVAGLVHQLAQAMHYAHEHGVVHRDLKPANILLQIADSSEKSAICNLQSAIPKITDFGLAKRLDVEVGQTQSGAILGTPSYMAPEQAMGKKDIGPAADVYALGAILYELLAGQPPFKGPTPLDTIMAVLTIEPRPVRQLQSAVPRDLETICAKCLAKEPVRRYASAGELAADLGRFINHESIRARPAGLWERGRKWVRRRPAAALGWLVALLLAAGGAGGYLVWQHFAELRQQEEQDRQARQLRTEYYAHLITRRGVSVGVDRLTPQEARRRNLTYQISVRGNRVEQVEIVTGYGRRTGRHFLRPALDMGDPTVMQRRECLYRYHYDDQGNVVEEEACDAVGRTVWKLHFDTPTLAHYTDPQGFPRPKTGSGAAYIRYAWDEHGWPREIWYLDRDRRPKPDRNGVYGERREFDEAGRDSRLTYLDLKGQPRRSNDRTAGWRCSYDRRGNRTTVSYVDPDGRPTVNDKRIHRMTTDFDKHGNLVAQRYFGLDGNAVTLLGGIAAVTQAYDDHGNQINEAFFGPDGRPVLHQAGGYHMVKFRTDEAGNPLEAAYFGTTQKPILNKQRFHLAKMAYDRRGNWLAMACFDERQRPTQHREGWHRWTRTYDDDSNWTQTAFFDVTGKPAPVLGGCPVMKMKYDARGNQVETAFFQVDGQAAMQQDGYHRVKQKYDDRDNEIDITYFDQSGRPVDTRSGYHQRTRGYDDLGNLNAEAFFDRHGKAVVPPAIGYHGMTIRWDGNGNRTEEAFFGADGKPILFQNGYHKLKKEYDARGNMVSRAFFDREDRPLAFHGVARWTLRYDDENQTIDVAAFDVRDKAVLLEVTPWKIEPHGPAARLDLRKGDVFVAYNGRPVANSYRLGQQRKSELSGDPPRKLQVRRQNRTFTVLVSPGKLGVYLENRAAHQPAKQP